MQYFFVMSSGSYSDYGVGGFFVADHPITEYEFHTFLNEQEQFENEGLAEIGATRYYQGGYSGGYKENECWVAYEKGRAFLQSIGSREARFVRLHNLEPVEYTELWQDN